MPSRLKHIVNGETIWVGDNTRATRFVKPSDAARLARLDQMLAKMTAEGINAVLARPNGWYAIYHNGATGRLLNVLPVGEAVTA